VTTVLLDTHVIVWWSAEPQRLSATAAQALSEADELAAAAISWFELAWLAHHDRIRSSIPIRTWLTGLATQLRTIALTPAIADTAVALPSSFPGDPADRLIYATAIEHGWRLVTKDSRLRAHRHPRAVALW
jgi:PIN domain nuclease of toxin-antitoxin system